MSYKSLKELEAGVFSKTTKKRVVAVAEACDSHVLEAVRDAVNIGLVDALLFGNKAKTEEKLRALGETPADYELIDSPSPEESALMAGIATREGRADFIMKGLIQTGALLKNLFREEAGFRTGRLISHMNILELDSYHKLLALTDAAVNLCPGLDQKKDILMNAVDTLARMGISNPKVAVLSSAETVNEKLPDSLDAAALKSMNQSGEIGGCIVEGPISYDLAICKEAAATKGYSSPVAGEADLLLCPGIVVGNTLLKALRHSAGALTAGLVIGGRVPVVLTSRASSAADKYRTMVMAASATM